jgi:hypothetical protein
MPDRSYQPGVYRKQGGTEMVVASGGALNVEEGGKFTTPVTFATASVSVSAAQSGTTFVVTAPDLTMTLPATAAGLRYTFVLAAAALSTGVGILIAPAAADAINGNGLTSTDGDKLACAAAGDREGDFAQLVGDGSDGWYIVGISGTWTKVT